MISDDLHPPWDVDSLEDLDLDRLAQVAHVVSQTRDALLSGISTVRQLDPAMELDDNRHTNEMVDELGRLLLAWDVIQDRINQLMNDQQVRKPFDPLASRRLLPN
ncbi:MAG: hypothetical protein HQL54_00510 [Magnetococcales bacterium]|nr:hypothetical protein [Magnetococcales bacterium]